MKIVLLNPPGDKRYVRSYYCGSTAKSNYLFQPLDLLMLSGRLYQQHEITVIDCIAERLTAEQAIKKIIEYKTEVIVSLVSIVSWKSDISFLSNLKRRIPSIIMIANGDVFFEEPEQKLMDFECIDAAIFDFISCDIINYLNGNEEDISNMLYRKGDKLIFKKDEYENVKKVFSIPMPRHELFLNKNYRFPFARYYPFTAILTNFGCPFQCSFCIANKLKFRYRQAKEVSQELHYVLKLGIKEIFFEDMSFGLPRENAVELCEIILKEKLRLSWSCFSRVDIVDHELLSLMREAGCHTIIFGVESASEKILRAHKKGYVKGQVIDTFKICRKLKIKTVGTFILGLPEETRESVLETIRFAKEIGCDYASFNVAAPRPGTELRQIAIKKKLIQAGQTEFDHSGRQIPMATDYLSKEELSNLRKKAIREFYLRPSYIFKNLATIKSFTQLKGHILEGIGLMANNIR